MVIIVFFSADLFVDTTVFYLRFPPFYQIIWLIQSLLWMLSLIFIVWAYNHQFKKVMFYFAN